MITLHFKTTINSSRTKSDWKTANKHLHRLHGKPAYQYWYRNGQKCSEEHFHHDLHHRLNGKPAWQIWYPNGQKEYEAYYENDLRHRLNGKPALQAWHLNGQKDCEEYYEHGKFIKSGSLLNDHIAI